jgi:hypothetical protein
MEKKSLLSNISLSMLSAIFLLTFSASTLWGKTNYSPSDSRKLYKKIPTVK